MATENVHKSRTHIIEIPWHFYLYLGHIGKKIERMGRGRWTIQ